MRTRVWPDQMTSSTIFDAQLKVIVPNWPWNGLPSVRWSIETTVHTAVIPTSAGWASRRRETCGTRRAELGRSAAVRLHESAISIAV